jgi:cytochrome P450
LYDYNLEPHELDPLIAMADVAMDQFSQATVPGRWLVDVFPMLAQVPEWFPGASFKKTARLWRAYLLRCVNIPYTFAKQKNRGGQASMSFVSRSLDEAEVDNGGSATSEEQEHVIKWAAVSLYVGGEDTSAETLNAFFLAMSMFPDVQRKAQEEIDRVVGTHRLPTFSDREQLPYLNAVIEEALRWHPILPMALPHTSDEEDHINGYCIPKDAILIPNTWWFTRDPNVYHDPETFKPERYMQPYNEPSSRDVVFGFGRRRCPGSVLADSSVYLTFAQVLAAFTVLPTVDESGNTVTNLHTFGAGVIAKVGPFKIDLKLRSEAHGVILNQLVEKYPSEESNTKDLDGLPKDLL